METIKRGDLSPRQQRVIRQEEESVSVTSFSRKDWYLQPDGTLTGLSSAHEAEHARNGRPERGWKRVV